MVRNAIADDYLLTYLTDVARQNIYAIGLILGQSYLGKDYVVHFAKTPLCESKDFKKDGAQMKQAKTLADIKDKWVADHAHQATTMLPGGMFVLGIFIVSPEDLLGQFNSKVKAILMTVHKYLEGEYLHGTGDGDKLVLNYCTKTQKYLAKSYDLITSRAQPVDFKFLPNATRWNSVECTYVIDQSYYLKTNEANWPLQKHIKGVLDDINNNLEHSIFLFDGESKERDEVLENLGKKKKVSRNSSSKSHPDLHDTKPIQVSIFQSSCSGPSGAHEVFNSAGQLRIVGQVISKVWLQPKTSIHEASQAVRQDIMRSLSSRLEMHWDSVTEEENSEDINCVHEPPRRVLITVPNSKITVSDYLFPGEGVQDAKMGLEELLDIKMDNRLEIRDAEGQADISEYYTSRLDSESEEVLPKLSTDANKFMYFIGLGFALFVLILSLLIHLFT